MEIHSQERKSNVAVNLGLDGDFDLEVEVQAELQSLLLLSSTAGAQSSVGDGGNLVVTDGTGGSELGSGLWGRHDVVAVGGWRCC